MPLFIGLVNLKKCTFLSEFDKFYLFISARHHLKELLKLSPLKNMCSSLSIIIVSFVVELPFLLITSMVFAMPMSIFTGKKDTADY